MGIATAIIALGIAFWISVGPERKGYNFEVAAAAGAEAPRANPVDLETQPETSNVNEKRDSDEKRSFDEEKADDNGVQTLTKDA